MLISKELEQEILDWHQATFPDADLQSQIIKWDEEYKEICFATNYDDLLMEIADCVIVATSFKRYGVVGEILEQVFNKSLLKIADHDYFDIENIQANIINDKVKEKLEINKTRKWKLENGIYKHIEE